MTTEQPVQADDDSADPKRKVTRMTFAERYKVTELLKSMVEGGHFMLPAKNWTALAEELKMMTKLPVYAAMCKEIAEVAGIPEDKLVAGKPAPVDHNAVLSTLTERIDALEMLVHSMSGVLKHLSDTVAGLAWKTGPVEGVPEIPPPQVDDGGTPPPEEWSR